MARRVYPLLAMRKLKVSCSDGEEETLSRLLCGKSASIAANVRLRQGFHEVHLSSSQEPLHIILGSNGVTAQLGVEASVGRISKIAANFSDGGLEAQNISGSLLNVHRIIDDAGIKRFSKSIRLSKPFLTAAAWWARKLESILGFSVRLEKISARACAADLGSPSPYLQLRFSGKLLSRAARSQSRFRTCVCQDM